MENLTAPHYPKRVLLLTAVMVSLLFALNFYFRHSTRLIFNEQTTQVAELSVLKVQLRQHQQAKEYAVRMAAFSGRENWENAHFNSRKALAADLDAIRAIVPGISDINHAPSTRTLDRLDEIVFKLVRLERREAAIAAVEGAHREILAAKQAALVTALEEQISRFTERRAEEVRHRSRASDKISWLVMAILVGLTVFMLRVFNSWARQIQLVNSGLDSLVREKMAELDKERMKMIESSKMATLGEMAGGIAHEINNPLAIIKLAAVQVEGALEPEKIDKEFLRERTAILVKTIDRIAKIVQGLRTFSRDGGQDPFRATSVQQIIDDTLALCGEQMKARGIEFQLDAIDPALEIDCRETQISQVILNLLSNAGDAIEKLENKWIRLSLRDLDTSIEIILTDSGRGIPAKIRGKLFMPFFSTKEVGKGTGIGLSISLGIVREHGGEITLDPDAVNTRFLIRLPKRQAKALRRRLG